MRKTVLLTMALALPTAIPASAQAQPKAPADVAAAVAAPGRPKAATDLDEVRKPAEVLRFMGLKKGDRVLDYFTGTGYYADIAARAVGPRGHVVGWNSAGFGRNERVVAALKDVKARNPNSAFYSSPVTAIALAPNSFDFALLHLVYHDAYWESAQFGLPRIDPATVVKAIWDSVKPGGTVAVIDHVATPGGDTREVVEKLHRIDPAVVRADFERAGFVLEAQSDILRVPSDDHSKNVFDPSIRGRTDRFVYRFRKPAR
ncbi:MAG TPA: methyltransferase domain-containing protein [Allosphingosinicella sp.]|jgi:predicted methyltransferase|nr:methyltransferase domain-containing protein [Allosphingosinicella sp.]